MIVFKVAITIMNMFFLVRLFRWITRWKPAPTSFSTPLALSRNMCTFLGIPKKQKLARVDVMYRIHKYISDNKLQDMCNRKVIHPDDKLNSLLSDYSIEPTLTYFNLPRYLKHNYV